MAQAVHQEVAIDFEEDDREKVDMRKAVHEWEDYLKNRVEGLNDFALATRLLTQRYKEETLPPLRISKNLRERARHNAEGKFFYPERDSLENVESLLKQIIRQRYRKYDELSEPIDLKDIPARRVIAAERMYQRNLIGLSKISKISKKSKIREQYYVPIGLEIGADSKHPLLEIYRNKGPKEIYRVHVAAVENVDPEQGADVVCDVICYHRSEPKEPYKHELRDQTLKDVSSKRAGDKYVESVSQYEGYGIVAQLKRILEETLGGSRDKLIETFKEMCSRHVVSNWEIRSMKDDDRRKVFLRNCFNILINEQSQFHSACFTEDDDWKLGMTVSFARLLKLFKDKYISLDDVFVTYALYSTKSVLSKFAEIRKTCETIDNLYQEKYNLNPTAMTESQALQDLEFLYGKSM